MKLRGLFSFNRLLRILVMALLGFCLSLIINLIINSTVEAQVSPSILVQQAQQQYQAGEFSQAIRLLQQANQIYQTENNNLQQAQVLALISLAQQQQGNWQQAQEQIDSSFTLLAQEPENKQKDRVLAQIWNSKGHLNLLSGQTNAALVAWETAEKLYQQAEDPLGVAGSLINQAQALENLGFYRRSCDRVLQAWKQDYRCQQLTAKQLTTIIQQVRTNPQPWQITGLNSIGNSMMLMGNLAQAEVFIRASQRFSRQLSISSPQTQKQILMSLGNLHKAISLQEKGRDNFKSFLVQSKQAIYYYQQLEKFQSAHNSGFISQLSAKLNQLSLFIATEQWSSAQKIVNQIDLDNNKPLTQKNIYTAVNFARSLTILQQKSISIPYSSWDIAQIYLQAMEDAQGLGDRRIESYATGYLGQLQYEQKLTLDSSPHWTLDKTYRTGIKYSSNH